MTKKEIIKGWNIIKPMLANGHYATSISLFNNRGMSHEPKNSWLQFRLSELLLELHKRGVIERKLRNKIDMTSDRSGKCKWAYRITNNQTALLFDEDLNAVDLGKFDRNFLEHKAERGITIIEKPHVTFPECNCEDICNHCLNKSEE